MLEVEVYPLDGTSDEPLKFDVDYVSLTSTETYGPPALVAPPRGRDSADPRAQIGDKVLYINTGAPCVFTIERLS